MANWTVHLEDMSIDLLFNKLNGGFWWILQVIFDRGNGSSFGMLINSPGPGCGWERWFRNSAGFLFGYIQCKSSSLGPYILILRMVPWVSEAPLDFWRTNSGKRRSCNSAKPPTPTLMLRGWKFWGLASSWQAGSHNFHCEFHIFSRNHRRNKSIQRKDSLKYINQIYIKECKKWLYISQVGSGCNAWPLKTAEHSRLCPLRQCLAADSADDPPVS